MVNYELYDLERLVHNFTYANYQQAKREIELKKDTTSLCIHLSS